MCSFFACEIKNLRVDVVFLLESGLEDNLAYAYFLRSYTLTLQLVCFIHTVLEFT